MKYKPLLTRNMKQSTDGAGLKPPLFGRSDQKVAPCVIISYGQALRCFGCQYLALC